MVGYLEVVRMGLLLDGELIIMTMQMDVMDDLVLMVVLVDHYSFHTLMGLIHHPVLVLGSVVGH
jgi:hypothetical protein